jgi:hypothetical protein
MWEKNIKLHLSAMIPIFHLFPACWHVLSVTYIYVIDKKKVPDFLKVWNLLLVVWIK